MNTPTNRRTFLKVASTGVAAATSLRAVRALGDSPNEKLVVGLIGCGGRGIHDAGLIKGVPNVEIAYVCDCDEQRRHQAAQSLGVESSRAIADMRTMLDDKSVDAVIVATPDHWHSPAVDSGLRSRQARLRRKTDLAQHSRRPVARRSGRRNNVSSTARHAKPQHRHDDRGGEAAARGSHRQRHGRQMLEHSAPRVDRTRARHRSARWPRLRQLGRTGNDDSLSHQPRSQSLDVVVSTSARATWATTAYTTSITPVGGWASNTHPSKVSAIGGKFFLRRRHGVSRHATSHLRVSRRRHCRQSPAADLRTAAVDRPIIRTTVDSGAEFYGTRGQMFLSRRGKIRGRATTRNKPVEVKVHPESQTTQPTWPTSAMQSATEPS